MAQHDPGDALNLKHAEAAAAQVQRYLPEQTMARVDGGVPLSGQRLEPPVSIQPGFPAPQSTHPKQPKSEMAGLAVPSQHRV